jgi:ribonuclease HI
MSEDIIIYTDGACQNNPGPGGWAAVLLYKGHKKTISGYSPSTTNNIMELTACIEALKTIKKDYPITIYSDSKYVISGITEWIKNWKPRWVKADGKPVLNKQYWIELDSLSSKFQITWKWVKGHSGDEYNELADQLAVAEISNHAS